VPVIARKKLDTVGECVLRDATTHDIEQLLDLCKAHADYEKAEFDSTLFLRNAEAIIVSDDFPCIWVVEHEGELIAYISFAKEFSTWRMAYYIHMDCIYIADTFRSYGLGEWMIKSMTASLAGESFSEVQWQTPEFNEGAIRFYNRIGACGKNKVRYFLPLD